MKNHPVELTVDQDSKTVYVTKEFNAELPLVWDAFTTAELLDQWWAPKPFLSKTKVMDFTVGGRRFYAMVTPEGNEMWQLQKYTSIIPKTHFSYFSAFADANENPSLPGSDWDFNFTENNGITKVSICIKNDSLERMLKMIEMGFKEGFTMTLNELDHVLLSIKK